MIEILQQQPFGYAVDIWGVGCLAVELATGSPPYHDLGKLLVTLVLDLLNLLL